MRSFRASGLVIAFCSYGKSMGAGAHSAKAVVDFARSRPCFRGLRKALREPERRELRRLTIDVSEDNLRVIAERGYEDVGEH